MKGKWFAVFLFFFMLLCFCVFLLSYNKYKKKLLVQEMDRHAEVIKEDVWTTNFSGPAGYLSLAAERDNYTKIELKDMFDENLLIVEGLKMTGLNHFLDRTGLLPETIMISKIKYEGQVIGTLSAHHRSMAFYIHFYIFLLFMLVYSIVMQFRKIVQVKKGLEEHVKNRTYELNITNQLLSKNIKILNQAQKFSHLGHFDYDLINNTLMWSDEVYRIFEQDPGKFTPTYEKYFEKLHPGDRAIAEKEYLNSIEKKKKFDFEVRILLDNGKIKYLQHIGQTEYNKNDKPVHTVGMILDITAGKQTETALLESEKKYSRLADSLPQVVFEIDATGNLIYVNQNAFDLFGYTKDEFDKGINIIQTLTLEDRGRALKNMQKVLNGTKADSMEYAALRRDGTTFPAVIHANLVTQNAKPVGLRGLLIDISERKKMEADLKRRALAIDHSSDTIVITDTKGNITYVNPAFEKITGYSQKEALGKNPRILQSGNHDKSFYEKLWKSISSGQTWSGRFINKKKDGSQYSEDATISPVFSDNGKITNYVAVKRDVSEKLKLESQLQQTQRMESIGTLAGGIAHDFNNILFPIMGHTEMLLKDITEDSPVRDSLKGIYTGALRAKGLVKQILTFSRQESGNLNLMKIQPIINEVLKLIRSSIPASIEIKQDLDPDCGVIKADPTQIHQIVMNLATNAYHAMEKTGGDLKVNLKIIKLSRDDVITPGITPGTYACLIIADTGIGMDKIVKEKIFDPFFTTKEKSKGTGMGLSVVHGIVQSMGGAIQVYSKPGKGTEFKVYFPMETGSFEEPNPQSNELIRGGTERIMLVDDEEAILTMEKMMLERLGYRVAPRISSIDALEEFRSDPAKFDLIITDMAMPNMSGDKLSAELVKIRTDIPVLLCTGFSETMSEERAESLGIKGFLLKPIVMKDFSDKIREVLDSKNSPGQKH